ncbi:MAG: RsmB/NOP family class I SAM-dependent RNA methyltransferase [Hyphomicrobiaceae bacterium]
MKPGARLASAAEVLGDIIARHRPAAQALSDWGKANRFAGSGDRAAIGNLVYDVLRRKRSLAAQMQSDAPRALVLGAASHAFAMTNGAVTELADGSRHAFSPLSADERTGLERQLSAEVAADVAGDYPEWLAPSVERAFGERASDEGAALARRAPVDLRANTLKAGRDQVLKALAKTGAIAGGYAPHAIRIAPPVGAGRTANVEAEAAHGRGWFEVQDEGSQIAAALAGAGAKSQVLDLCAGAGGKTLALAADMANTGQIYAYDANKHQLRPIFERLKRAGVRNAQVIDGGDEAALRALDARFDIVFVDAPCTGSGVWRRRPDAKWRVKPANLATRIAEQQRVLTTARALVRPGGRLVYVTCSILPEENIDQVDWFTSEAADFVVVPYAERWRATLGEEPPTSADGREDTLLLSPARHQTDGFFIATFERRS